MSNLRIIDASVAIKWFLIDEVKRKEAILLLDEIQKSPHYFAVPELFFNEMLAVLCRLVNDSAIIKKYINLLENLGLHRLGNGSELLSTAAYIAIKYQLTGYDAIYAASAQIMQGTWITADIKAHKRIDKLKISIVL